MGSFRPVPNTRPARYPYIDFHKHLTEWCKKNGYAFEVIEGETNYWVLKAKGQWVHFIQYGVPKQAEKPNRVQCGRVYRAADENENKEGEFYLSHPVSFGRGSAEKDDKEALQMVSIDLIGEIQRKKSIKLIDYEEEERKHNLMKTTRSDGKAPQTLD